LAFSEGLSDNGELTGRGNSYLRGSITGAGTFLGGILHTLPFLIPQYRAALIVAVVVITFDARSSRSRLPARSSPPSAPRSEGRLAEHTLMKVLATAHEALSNGRYH
jgi:hypothetical protein